MKTTKFIAFIAILAFALSISQSNVFAWTGDSASEVAQDGMTSSPSPEASQDNIAGVVSDSSNQPAQDNAGVTSDPSTQPAQDNKAGVSSNSSSEADQDGFAVITPAPVTPVTPSGGSTSGGSSYSSGGSVPTNLPIVVSASCPLLTSYLKAGSANDATQVAKLQAFLKNVEKLNVDINGTFDQKTEDAVKAFQTKYLSSILGPWSATRATGIVYITTLKKINELACASPITLSADEQAIIKAYNDRVSEAEQAAQTSEVGQGTIPSASSTLAVGIDDESNVAAVGRASILSRFWNFIKNLFR